MMRISVCFLAVIEPEELKIMSQVSIGADTGTHQWGVVCQELYGRRDLIKTVSSLENVGIRAGSRILLVFAHPDDESVFAAGFIQQALNLSVTVRLITLTCGEAGSTRYGLRPGDDLGLARSKELQKACHILGPFSCRVFDFPDSGLSSQHHEIHQALEAELKQFQPDHLIGFAPDGITGHSDHRAASRAVALLHQTDPSRFQLIFATGHRNHRRPGARGIDLVVTLTPEQRHRKIQALEAHKSQFTPSGIRGWFSSDRMDIEHFFLPL